MHEERSNKHKSADQSVQEGAIPTYLMDRENQSRAKVLSNMIKQKRKEKAGKWDVPIPKVKGMDEAEVFRVVKTGKRKSTLSFSNQNDSQTRNTPNQLL
jgi:ribosome biogenesis protein NSA2